MPGHFNEGEEIISTQIKRLEELISSHDVIFLLTDSRESRWLPSLLGAHFNKTVINAALGFDGYVGIIDALLLVMRHGMKNDPQNERLGCYFCNDVVAPTDSLSNRTLDQQCTVTRPGLSGVASGVAVELFATLLNHPLKYILIYRSAFAKDDAADTTNVLGRTPHQIRGSLSDFSTITLSGKAYDKCPACSDIVLNAYKEEGSKFILKALSTPKYLEDLTGLTKLHDETADIDLDWD